MLHLKFIIKDNNPQNATLESKTIDLNKVVLKVKDRILVVDDEPHNLNILRIFLSSLNYELYEAVCGQDALNMVDEIDPDLILLDVMLPDLSGFEVCEQLNKRCGFKTPIIFLSANVQKDAIQRGLSIGGVDYLKKPFDFDLIEKKMSLALADAKNS
jgi:DNA-binding response OmpR family regulator